MNEDENWTNEGNNTQAGGEQGYLENPVQRVPAPYELKQNRIKKWKKVGSVALAIALFGAGYLASDLQYDSGLKTLAKIKRAIQSKYYEKVTDDEFYGLLFDTINEDLLDKYSKYMSPDEYSEVRTEATGEWSGVGLTFVVEDEAGNEQMLVKRVSGNSPAEKAGVREGDYIVAYGTKEGDLIVSEEYDSFYQFIQERTKGEEFIVKVRRGSEVETITLYKSTFVENYVFYRTNQTAYACKGDKATEWTETGDKLACLDDKTAYIRLTQFNCNAGTEFAKAMAQFKADGKSDLVLDLRDNGGGYMDVLQEISSYFCEGESGKALVAVAKYRAGQREEFLSDKSKYAEFFTEESKIRVLANDGTASASECLIGCMLDYGAISYADICLTENFGVAKTYGKGIMQSTYPLGLINAAAIKLTTAQVFWPISGNCIHGRGILPEDGTKVSEQYFEKDLEIVHAIEKFQP